MKYYLLVERSKVSKGMLGSIPLYSVVPCPDRNVLEEEIKKKYDDGFTEHAMRILKGKEIDFEIAFLKLKEK